MKHKIRLLIQNTRIKIRVFFLRLFKYIDNRKLLISQLKGNKLPRPNSKSVERNFLLMNIMLKEQQYNNLDYLDCISETTKKQVNDVEKDISFIVDDDEEISVFDDEEDEYAMFYSSTEESGEEKEEENEMSENSTSGESDEESDEEYERSDENEMSEEEREKEKVIVFNEKSIILPTTSGKQLF